MAGAGQEGGGTWPLQPGEGVSWLEGGGAGLGQVGAHRAFWGGQTHSDGFTSPCGCWIEIRTSSAVSEEAHRIIRRGSFIGQEGVGPYVVSKLVSSWTQGFL